MQPKPKKFYWIKTYSAENTLLFQFYPGQTMENYFFAKKRIVHCFLD